MKKLLLSFAFTTLTLTSHLAQAENVNYKEFLKSITTAELSAKNLVDSEGIRACANAPIVASMYQGGAAQSLALSICRSLNKDFIVTGYKTEESKKFFNDTCYYMNSSGIQYSQEHSFLSLVRCGKK